MRTNGALNKTVATLCLCEEYYSKKTLQHAIRVATYAYAEAIHSSAIGPADAYVVGLAHDLIEDTDCPAEKLEEILEEDLMSSVNILTKSEDEDYNDYIKSIVESKDRLALLVKRVDIKDHLMQAETLTDKLKEKYYPVMGLLM